MTKRLYPEDLKVGHVYRVGYRGWRWLSTFRGWFLDDDGQPRMRFEDGGGVSEWHAYLFKGRLCVGSSADLLVLESIN